MKKRLLILIFALFMTSVSYADAAIFQNDTRAIKSMLKSQVRYANKNNFDKFISTYDSSYVNSDGLNLNDYSNLVKEIWSNYYNLSYDIKINDINIQDDTATVSVTETSHAIIPATEHMNGVMNSVSNSIYNLKKSNGKWKVLSDNVLDENTSMMYGEAMNLDVKLTAPNNIAAKTEYTASLEFIPPKNTFAIASIANDIVEYPQKPTKEVFRKMPDDNILERLFIANSDKKNEYIVASIGLTKADIKDLSIKVSLTGFGYKITRVNVIPETKKEESNAEK